MLTINSLYLFDNNDNTFSSPSKSLAPCSERYSFSYAHNSSIIAVCTSFDSNGNSLAAISYIGSPIHSPSSFIVTGGLFISACLFNTTFHDSQIGTVESHNVPSRSNIIESNIFKFLQKLFKLFFLCYIINYRKTIFCKSIILTFHHYLSDTIYYTYSI